MPNTDLSKMFEKFAGALSQRWQHTGVPRHSVWLTPALHASDLLNGIYHLVRSGEASRLFFDLSTRHRQSSFLKTILIGAQLLN